MSEQIEKPASRRGLLAAAIGLAGVAGAGALARPAHADDPASAPLADGVVNVHDHGATGDGTTDDSAAILAAIAAAAPGEAIFFPSGTYLVSKTMRPKAGQVLFATGNDTTIRSANGAFVMFVCSAGPVQFHHLHIDGARSTTSSPANPNVIRCILVQATAASPSIDLVINDCHIDGAWGNGIETVGRNNDADRVTIRDTVVENCGVYGIQLRSTNHGLVDGCVLRKNRHGLGGDEVQDVTAHALHVVDNDRHGIVFVYSQYWHVDNCRCERNGLVLAGGWGIAAGGLYRDPVPAVNSHFTITNNVCDGNGAGGITVDPAVAQQPSVIQVQQATVANNTCVKTQQTHGINITHAREVVVSDNVCTSNPISGVQVSSASHVLVQGNICAHNHVGIGLSSNTTVTDPGHHVLGVNMLYDNDEDIYHEWYNGAYPLSGTRTYGQNGADAPEGKVQANPGTQYEQHDGDKGALYVKETGQNSTTGWRRLRGSAN